MMESINIVIDDSIENKKENEDEDVVSPQQTHVLIDVLPKVSNIESKNTILKSSKQQETINHNSEGSSH